MKTEGEKPDDSQPCSLASSLDNILLIEHLILSI